jgi:hypothetical protein
VTAIAAAVRAGHASGKLLGPPLRDRDDNLPLRWMPTRVEESAGDPPILAAEREARFGAASMRKALLHYVPPPTAANNLVEAITTLSRTADAVTRPPGRALPPHPHTRTGLRRREDVGPRDRRTGRTVGGAAPPPAV